MYLINGNRIIKNFVLHVFSVSQLSSYYYSLVLHHWLIKLSKITNFRVDFSFVAKSAAKVLLFFGLTKFLSNFFQYFCIFFVSGWFSALHFSMLFAVFYRSLAFIAKSAAKVLLFCELTKYFEKFFTYFLHFLYKSLIINNTF